MAGKFFGFIGAYFRANLGIALEYRASLVYQVMGMFLNDIVWVIYWVFFFKQFPVLRGWTLEDVLVLWSSVPFSIGLVAGFTANSMRLPQLIREGQLDYYLTLPKNVLLHLLVSQIRLVNFGDVLFGPLLLIFMVKLTWARVMVFLAASLLASVVELAFFVLVGSLAFFMGDSETLSGQLSMTLLHFATYPTSIFEGGVKILLFTVVPAGFVATLPVELVREFHWLPFLELMGAAAFFLTVAVAVFNWGLRRYESGNLMMLRS